MQAAEPVTSITCQPSRQMSQTTSETPDIDNTDNDVDENAICVGRFFQQFGEDCVREVMARKIEMQQHVRDAAGDHNTKFTHTVFEVSLGIPL